MPNLRIVKLFYINDLEIQKFPPSPKNWINSNKLNFWGRPYYFIIFGTSG